jgi:hypothetical protein
LPHGITRFFISFLGRYTFSGKQGISFLQVLSICKYLIWCSTNSLTGMSEKKRLTIGVTVNLEHYENLRVDVEGEVENDQDANELVRFLDRTLAGFGRADPATAKRVDSYRERVLSSRPIGSTCYTGVCALPENLTPYISPTEGTVLKDPKSPPTPSGLPGGKDTDRQGSLTMNNPDTPFHCDACGAPVSAAEKKASQLFASKTLCKTCLKTAR